MLLLLNALLALSIAAQPPVASRRLDLPRFESDSAFEEFWDHAYEAMIESLPERGEDIRLAEDSPPPWPVKFFTSALSTNVRINDPTGDDPSEVQSETAAAAYGKRVIVGWNDSKGFTTGTVSSYGYTRNGGVTWFDGGNMPLAGLGAGEQLQGDPGLCSNRQGKFWMCSLYLTPTGSPGQTFSSIGVSRGQFTGTTPFWFPPVAVGTTLADFADKPAIACDAQLPYVYLLWTHFYGAGGAPEMRFSRSLDGGLNWGAPVVLGMANPGLEPEAGALLVDEQGWVHAFWENDLGATIGTGLHSQMIHRRSTDFGATFAAADTAAHIRQNWYAAPPGFNRRTGFWEFPNIARDTTSSPWRGSLYLTWNEACEPAFSGTVFSDSESESNNFVAEADSVALPTRITASIGINDIDYYRFEATAGQMVRLTLQPSISLFPWMRLACAPDADTFLVDCRVGTGFPARGWVTLPSTGTYYVDVRSPINNQGSYTLDIETVTAAAGSRALDHRDIVFSASHDHGTTWTTPVRVNDDPPYFDNCMPLITVDSLGIVHMFWYDRRNDPVRGGATDLYYSRSTDGGATWAPNVRITDQATTWQVPARSQPNFGDYSSAAAFGNTILPFWADGRFGTPDVFTSIVRSGFDLTCWHDTLLMPGDTLRAHFEVKNLSPYTERFVYTITDSLGIFAPASDSLVLGPQAGGQVTFKRYAGLFGAPANDKLTLTAFYRSTAYAKTTCRPTAYLRTNVAGVPEEDRAGTALGAIAPNPARGPVRIAFSLARPGPARIEVFDVAGRRVARLVDGPRPAGGQEIEWNAASSGNHALGAGVYFVRAELLGQVSVRRILVL